MPVASFAQKRESNEVHPVQYVDYKKTKSSFAKFYIGTSNSNTIAGYFLKTIPALQISGSGLILVTYNESPAAKHYTFLQHINSIPVYRGELKVNLDKNENVISLFDNTFSLKNIELPVYFPDSLHLLNMFTNIQSVERYLYLTSETQCLAVQRVVFFDENKYMEVLVNTNYQVVYSRNLNSFYAQTGTDSTVSAMVFNPDPLTSAGVSYGGQYKDFGDADNASLNGQRVSVNMKVGYNNDTFKLENPYVIIKDFSAPTVAPVYTIGSPVFNYLRSQSGFENVNAYYHITNQQQHLQLLGFTNLVNYQIWVDTWGTSADNSFFSPGYSPPRLTFGTGGVDDAEDADVIIHEYGHAISHSAAPGTNNGTERQTLDEANGDYFAASYSKNINSFNWQNVYSWDGHNEYWPGREVLSSKHYPEDLANDIYDDADIWSSTLMQIWDKIGRNEADATLLQSLYSYASNMTMEDAAGLYMQADALLFAGKNADILCTHFYNRGLFSNCFINPDDGKNIHLFNTEGFGDGGGVVIRFSSEVESATFTIFDTLGRKVFSFQKSNLQLFVLDGGAYPKGIYILRVETPGETGSFKLIND